MRSGSLTSDLEEVEEVGCGSVDSNEIFVGLGRGVRKVNYGEVIWALGERIRKKTWWKIG